MGNMTCPLSKNEFFDAVKEGVKEAILTMTESGDGYSGLIRTEEFMEAIKDGTRYAIRDLFDEYPHPGANFFEAVRKGVCDATPSD